MYKIMLPIIIAIYSSLSYASIDELEALAKKGDTNAQFRLGLVYEKGTSSISSDYREAEYWYEMAYKKGNVKAASRLALMFMESGDNQTAKKYLKDGLKEKFPYSLYLYGKIMVNEGNKKGLDFIEFAAKKGVPDALYDISKHNGNKEEYYNAYIYAKLASMKRKREASELLHIYGREITPKQLISANMKASRLMKEMEK